MLGRKAPLCRTRHPSPSPLKAEKTPNINSHVGALQCKAERRLVTFLGLGLFGFFLFFFLPEKERKEPKKKHSKGIRPAVSMATSV